MSLGAESMSLFFRQQAEELTRIWRMARATARPAVFPGLLDGLVGPFFARTGEVLEKRGAPPAVWQGLVGLLRRPPAVAPVERPVTRLGTRPGRTPATRPSRPHES